MEAKQNNINSIWDIIISFFWAKDGAIFSVIFLFLSPIIYGVIRIVPNENFAQWLFVLYTLILIVIVMFRASKFIEQQIDKKHTSSLANKLEKKEFFAKFGLITLKNLLLDKEAKLTQGDKVIVYTSKLTTENGKIIEDGEVLNVNEIVENNRQKGVEYNILYYQKGDISDDQLLEIKNLYGNKLFELSPQENSVDYQLSEGERTGFDLVLYNYHSSNNVEAYFCVNYVAGDTESCNNVEYCVNPCRQVGEKKNNNLYLLYKQIQNNLAIEIYNKLSKRISPNVTEISYIDQPQPQSQPKEKTLLIVKFILVFIIAGVIPLIGYWLDFKELIGINIRDSFFCFMLYFIIVTNVILMNKQKLVYTNITSLKNLLRDYRLTTEEKMNKKEKYFGKMDKENKEIWIFSYDLSTEILNDKCQKIVKKNIEKETQYIEFYYDNDKNKEEIVDRCNKIKSSLKEEYRKNINFIPLENNKGEINLLPRLIGSVSFHKGVSFYKKESYFSLRGGKKTKPIYYNMPACMSDAYYNYFLSRKQEFDNKNK